MAQWESCLLSKCEELSSQHPFEGVQSDAQLQPWTMVDFWARLPDGPGEALNSRFYEIPVSKIKTEK